MNHVHKLIAASMLSGTALLIGACSDSGDGGGADTILTGLPEGLTLAMLDKAGGQFYALDTTTGVRTDLNEAARSSTDPAVRNLEVTDTSVIGHFLHWPDAADHDHDHAKQAEEGHDDEHGEGEFEQRFVLMRPDYEPGSVIDADQFVVLIDFHGDELAGHTADEYRDQPDGSVAAEELERLNAFVVEQQELVDEVTEAMPDGQTLCSAYIDPYLAGEHGDEHAHGDEPAKQETGDEHGHDEHGELIHYALTDTGRVYFFEEHTDGLELAQETFVQLTGVSSILDCSATTIARASDEGVLIFVPDSQFVYFVDAHEGADFHQHSRYAVADMMPAGVRADLIAIVGAGEDHDHDDEG